MKKTTHKEIKALAIPPYRRGHSLSIALIALTTVTTADVAWAEASAPQADNPVPYQGRIKMTQYRGLWSASLRYRQGQVVFFGNQSWIALRNGINARGKPTPPASTNPDWAIFSSLGATGPEGAQGPVGPQGPAGPQGLMGMAGSPGPTGLPGAKGDTGAQGPVGATGPKGDTGAQGPVGATGPKGDTGAQGPVGATGPKGDTGAQGPVGATGPKGDTGATGAQGPKGDTGPSGTSVGVYAPSATRQSNEKIKWTVPNTLPTQNFLATITGIMRWTGTGNTSYPNEADCTVIGLTGLTPQPDRLRRNVTVSWDINYTKASASFSFTGYVNGSNTTEISLDCTLPGDGILLGTSQAEISLVNLDTVDVIQ